MRMLGRCRWVPVLLLPLGCYTYVPVGVDALDPGAAVRARITPEHAARLREVLPTTDRLLEGTAVQAADTALMLLVPAAARTTSSGIEILHQRISIPRHELVEVELKRLSRGRTAALVGTGAAIAAALIIRQFTGSEDSRRPDQGAGPEESVVPAHAYGPAARAGQRPAARVGLRLPLPWP